MQPKAVLIVYEPGHKLKNHKFLLSFGANIVGRDSQCRVILPSKQHLQQDYAANIFVTEYFLYIEALCQNLVRIKSNICVEGGMIKKKQNFYPAIDAGHRYVLPLEEIFFMGKYKCMVQVLTVSELKNINNILNKQHFETPGRNQPMEVEGEQKKQNNEKWNKKNQEEEDALSDRTEKIESDNGDQFAPTLVLNDQDAGVFMPTIDLNAEQIDQRTLSQRTQSLLKPRRAIEENFEESDKSSNYQRVTRSFNKNASPCTSQNNKKRKANNLSQVSDVSLFSKQKEKQEKSNNMSHLSQTELYQTIKKDQLSQRQSEQNQEQEMISMPDTVKDQDMDQIMDQMPPTVQDDDDEQSVQSKQSEEKKPQVNVRVLRSSKNSKKYQDKDALFDELLFQKKQVQQKKNVKQKKQQNSNQGIQKKWGSLLSEQDPRVWVASRRPT